MTTPSEQSYRLIPLTQGQFTKVDAADYEWLNQWKWYAWKSPCTKSFYAMRRVGEGRMQMQRVVLGLDFGNPIQADHINRDTLDNRRSNLRLATHQQSQWNRKLKVGKSGRKGVYLSASGNQWIAHIRENGRVRYLGRFPLDQLEQAAKAYEEAARRIHGEFVCL